MTDEPIERDDEAVPAPLGEEPPDGRRTWWLVGGAVVLLVALLAGLWALGGDDDDGDDVAAGSGGEAPGFWVSRWQLTESANGNQGTTYTDSEFVLDATIEGTVSFNGCNGGTVVATLDGDRLAAEEFAMTQMACVDEEGESGMGEQRMAVDELFAALLPADPTVTVEGDTLTITASETLTAIFLRLPPGPMVPDPGTPLPGDPDAPVSSDDDPSATDPGVATSAPATVPGSGGGTPGSPGADAFWGQRWEVASVTTASGSGLALLPDGSAPAIDALTEGPLSFTGCNGGRGQGRIEGDRLVAGPFISTKMACGGPEGEALMAQDAAIAAILEDGPVVTFDGDTLVLTAGAGTLEAVPQG